MISIRSLLPEGIPLPQESWDRRHRAIIAILWAHVVWIAAWGQMVNVDWLHPMVEAGAVAMVAVAATLLHNHRGSAAVASTLGLLMSSGIIVHFSGGLIEMHFHFFVMVALITLYQSWLPFLIAIVFVLIHHGTVGVLDPSGVYNHAEAIAHPWKWATIHAAFITGISAVGLTGWKLNEVAQKQAQTYHNQLYDSQNSVIDSLKAADDLKEEFIAVVSHELRTPLTTIIGYARLLETRDEDQLSAQDQRDYISRILRQGHRLNSMVENLIETSKTLAEPDQTFSSAGEVINAVIERQKDELDHHPMIIKAQPELHLQIPPEALALILTNLVGNAVKFSVRKAPVTVNLRRYSHNEVEISVSNASEVGIPLEIHKKIFEPFFQPPESREGTGRGVGLGLHIVNRLVSRYGGHVSLQNEEGAVTFSVILPEATIPTTKLEGASSQ